MLALHFYIFATVSYEAKVSVLKTIKTTTCNIFFSNSRKKKYRL